MSEAPWACRCCGPHCGCAVCLLLGVEALVGWLLDHADVQVTDLSDADTGSEECSDEEVMEDVDDTAYAMVSASLVPVCSEFWIPLHCSMGPLCGSAGHVAKLLRAAWVFCALIAFRFNICWCWAAIRDDLRKSLFIGHLLLTQVCCFMGLIWNCLRNFLYFQLLRFILLTVLLLLVFF